MESLFFAGWLAGLFFFHHRSLHDDRTKYIFTTFHSTNYNETIVLLSLLWILLGMRRDAVSRCCPKYTSQASLSNTLNTGDEPARKYAVLRFRQRYDELQFNISSVRPYLCLCLQQKFGALIVCWPNNAAAHMETRELFTEETYRSRSRIVVEKKNETRGILKNVGSSV